MKQAFFSVIIATFNRSCLIEKAIHSLLNQEETDFEALIIDDGSTDDTIAKVTHLIGSDVRFRIFKNEANQGVVYTKNRGISLSKGTYITFLDSDDEYRANHLKTRKEILVQRPSIDLLHGGLKINGNPCVPDIHRPGKLISITDCVASGTFFIHNERCGEFARFEEPALLSDANFYQLMLSRKAVIVKTEIPSYIYHHDTEGSISNPCG